MVLFFALLTVAHFTGLFEDLDPEEIQVLVNSAGAWGALLFVAIFCVGSLMHLPGWVFITSAVLLWGFLPGMLISFVGSVISVTVSFLLIRLLGGRALAELKWKWARNVLSKLDQRPVLTVVILRIVFGVAPFLNYSLAMTNLRLRDHTVGSFFGMIGPVAFVAAATEFFTG